MEKPILHYYEYTDGPVTVIALTPESDNAWAAYLRKVTQAKIALISQTT